MSKKTISVAETLNKLIDEYQLNPNSLSKAINLSQTTVRLLTIGKANITVPIAARLGKFFGPNISFWLNVQLANDIQKASEDKKLLKILSAIPKAQKPTGKKVKAAPKPKTAGKAAKRNNLAEKRKKAAKVPGARPAKGKKK